MHPLSRIINCFMNHRKYEKGEILDCSKQQVISDFQRTSNDVGSPEVQVALLERRIAVVSQHLQASKRNPQSKTKDNNSYRRLRMFIGQRQRLLRYLRSKSQERYAALIAALGIKDRV